MLAMMLQQNQAGSATGDSGESEVMELNPDDLEEVDPDEPR